MKDKKLVIISHTEHYKNEDGLIVGWGPTIREINFLAQEFKEIVHIGTLHSKEAPKSSQRYTSSNIKFSAISPFGGKGILKKLGVLFTILRVIKIVKEEVKWADYVQLRLPTGIGVYLLPFFAFVQKRTFTFWVKYAGNWNEKKPPYGYRFQRWFLKRNFAKCKVTINGFWPNQPKHCISFENPCLTEEQLKWGLQVATTKKFKPPFNFLFVGRLEDAKGVSRILEAFKTIDVKFVNELVFVGDGEKRIEYEKASMEMSFVKFLGGFDNQGVHEEMKKADFLLLPSDSEGFPKVIAEAACYGVIPIVSNAGSIGHYINKTNGFVADKTKLDIKFNNILMTAIKTDSKLLKQISNLSFDVASKFTFENFIFKIKVNIFC